MGSPLLTLRLSYSPQAGPCRAHRGLCGSPAGYRPAVNEISRPEGSVTSSSPHPCCQKSLEPGRSPRTAQAHRARVMLRLRWPYVQARRQQRPHAFANHAAPLHSSPSAVRIAKGVTSSQADATGQKAGQTGPGRAACRRDDGRLDAELLQGLQPEAGDRILRLLHAQPQQSGAGAGCMLASCLTLQQALSAACHHLCFARMHACILQCMYMHATIYRHGRKSSVHEVLHANTADGSISARAS